MLGSVDGVMTLSQFHRAVDAVGPHPVRVRGRGRGRGRTGHPPPAPMTLSQLHEAVEAVGEHVGIRRRHRQPDPVDLPQNFPHPVVATPHPQEEIHYLGCAAFLAKLIYLLSMIFLKNFMNCTTVMVIWQKNSGKTSGVITLPWL